MSLEKIADRNKEDRVKAKAEVDRLVKAGHLSPRMGGYLCWAVTCETNTERAVDALMDRA